MSDDQSCEFTCKTCGDHQLTVYRVWTILAGPDTENWQEWGPWELPNRGGRIFPVECSDFNPGKIWPEPRYLASWHQKHWLGQEDEDGSPRETKSKVMSKAAPNGL